MRCMKFVCEQKIFNADYGKSSLQINFTLLLDKIENFP